MPNARPSGFAEGDTQRALPPASPGLRAPAGKSRYADERRQRRHPARNPQGGAQTAEEKQELVETTMALMDAKSPADIAIALGMSAAARPVREVIRSARQSLQELAEAYVLMHAKGAAIAALSGDTKPAQWALERIAEEGERVIDPPQAEAKQNAPVFNIGFALGGVPAPSLPPANMTIDAEPVK